VLEERFRVVVRFSLHVLRQANGDCTRLGWRRQNPHGFRQRRDQLFGTIDAIPIAGHRLETIVHRDVLGGGGFELLQDGRGRARRENIARQ
jgi:hypothetical protein